MTLSKQELQQLAELETQFESGSPVSRWTARLRIRHQRSMVGLGWTLVTVGSILVLVLLQISVAASFVCFLIAVAGLLLLVDGDFFADWAARLRRTTTSEQPDA